jgi:predicted esterase
MVSAHASSIPVFWGHGTADPLVNIEFGRRSVEWLKKELKPPAKDVTFKEYDGVEHSASVKELEDLKAWLSKVLPQES